MRVLGEFFAVVRARKWPARVSRRCAFWPRPRRRDREVDDFENGVLRGHRVSTSAPERAEQRHCEGLISKLPAASARRWKPRSSGGPSLWPACPPLTSRAFGRAPDARASSRSFQPSPHQHGNFRAQCWEGAGSAHFKPIGHHVAHRAPEFPPFSSGGPLGSPPLPVPSMDFVPAPTTLLTGWPSSPSPDLMVVSTPEELALVAAVSDLVKSLSHIHGESLKRRKGRTGATETMTSRLAGYGLSATSADGTGNLCAIDAIRNPAPAAGRRAPRDERGGQGGSRAARRADDRPHRAGPADTLMPSELRSGGASK